MQILTVDVNQVVFSQSSICSAFGNKTPLMQCVAEFLQEGNKADEDWMLLDVCRSPQTAANVYISQNNRRLFCLKLFRFAQPHIRVRVSTHGKVKQNVDKSIRIRSLEFGAATFDVPCQCIWIKHKVGDNGFVLEAQRTLRGRFGAPGSPFATLFDLFPMQMELSHKICFWDNTAKIKATCFKGKVTSVDQCCHWFDPCVSQVKAYRGQSLKLWSQWHNMAFKVLYIRQTNTFISALQ